MAQPREKVTDRGQQRGRAAAILDVGGMHRRRDERAAGVGDDVGLAAIDLLARVIAAGSALTNSAAQACLQTHRQRHPGSQLPEPAARPRDLHAQ